MSVLTTHHTTATTVPRQLVHKAAQSEVLLTGWESVGENTFRITAQWPRTHSFYDTADARHDPLLIAETVRQAVPLLSHLGYQVPIGHRQIWDHLTWTVNPDALLTEATPAEIEMRIECSDVVRRGTRLAALSMSVDIVRDGIPLGTASTRFANQAPAVYTRLRGVYGDLTYAQSRAVAPPPPVTPQQVGRDRFRDVVLSPGTGPHRFQLRADLNHPALFDHPVDHAPGMLMLEAARQAAHAVAHPEFAVITGMGSVFSRYVEFDAPCWIEAEVLPSQLPTHVSSRVTAVQHGRTVFSTTVTALRGPSAAAALQHF
ncbi:ScbA/BarX family gamma-butyrolactone biosynthesis protein [Streptomyces sp. NPDC003023]|uniref:ScbA/BarX family gamma-butyrolactone biosynthesis protein n=1 Tax=Streptomyces sp. NPDC003023 TaxID=3364675 RepID=UPI00369632CE